MPNPIFIAADIWPSINRDPTALKAAEFFSPLFSTIHFDREPDDPQVRHIWLSPRDDTRRRYIALHNVVLCSITDHQTLYQRNLDRLKELAQHNAQLDTHIFFIVCRDDADAGRLAEIDSSASYRTYIPIAQAHLYGADRALYLDSLLTDYLSSRDLFLEKHPVSGKFDFFARGPLVNQILDSVDRGQNVAILGLRRIGKTSIVKQIQRLNDEEARYRFFALDVQAQRWVGRGHTGADEGIGTAADALLSIVKDLHEKWYEKHKRYLVAHGNIPKTLPLREAEDYFQSFVKRFLNKSNQRLLLLIDDFQELLPTPFRHSRWNEEYLSFAAALKTASLENGKKFVFLIASTNPNFIREEFHGHQNPLLTYVDYHYVDPFTYDDLKDMLKSLASQMKLIFDDDALAEIYRLFGGHPFLSREFCSLMRAKTRTKAGFPASFTRDHVQATFEAFGDVLDPDFNAILENLRVAFPDEYKLVLRLVEARTPSDVLANAPTMFRNNLIGYGITDHDQSIKMEGLQRYIRRLLESDRYLDDSALIQDIEAMLRQVIKISLRVVYRSKTDEHLLKGISEVLALAVARPVESGVATQARLEDCRLPQLIELIYRDWNVFDDLIGRREILDSALAAYRKMHARPVRDEDHTPLSEHDRDAFMSLKAAVTELAAS